MATQERLRPWFGLVIASLWSATCATTAWLSPTQTLLTYVPSDQTYKWVQDAGVGLIDLLIRLPPENVEERDALLVALYTPGSTHFREFLSPSEYRRRFAPSPKALSQLQQLARYGRLHLLSDQRDFSQLVRLTENSDSIKAAFNVEVANYARPDGGTFHAPSKQPPIDRSLTAINVSGLDNLQELRRISPLSTRQARKSVADAGSGPAGVLSAASIRAAYIPGMELDGSGQVVGILELQQHQSADVEGYKKGLTLSVPVQTIVAPGCRSNGVSDEASADIELVMAMAPKLDLIEVYEADETQVSIVEALYQMANPAPGERLANQVTTSYVVEYDQNVEEILIQMAMQGQSVFVPTGDLGSYVAATADGFQPISNHRLVTAVGGTILHTDVDGGWVSESAWNAGGGGYIQDDAGALWFPTPPWQSGMDLAASKGSSEFRNVPDVAMVATNIEIFKSGRWTSFEGTSAGAPLWAGFMALVNQYAAKVDALHSGGPLRGPIGFANPSIYAIARSGRCPNCFHDVTEGRNLNAGTDASGYEAVPGYDLCTGWGTPNGPALIPTLVNYPN